MQTFLYRTKLRAISRWLAIGHDAEEWHLTACLFEPNAESMKSVDIAVLRLPWLMMTPDGPRSASGPLSRIAQFTFQLWYG
jgi:hypothetical protein